MSKISKRWFIIFINPEILFFSHLIGNTSCLEPFYDDIESFRRKTGDSASLVSLLGAYFNDFSKTHKHLFKNRIHED